MYTSEKKPGSLHITEECIIIEVMCHYRPVIRLHFERCNPCTSAVYVEQFLCQANFRVLVTACTRVQSGFRRSLLSICLSVSQSFNPEKHFKHTHTHTHTCTCTHAHTHQQAVIEMATCGLLWSSPSRSLP